MTEWACNETCLGHFSAHFLRAGCTLTIAHQLKGVLGAVVPGTDGCTDTKNGRIGPDLNYPTIVRSILAPKWRFSRQIRKIGLRPSEAAQMAARPPTCWCEAAEAGMHVMASLMRFRGSVWRPRLSGGVPAKSCGQEKNYASSVTRHDGFRVGWLLADLP